MAGEWIKMRIDLSDDPAVICIAEATGLDPDAVVGKLHRLWSWADRHTKDGKTSMNAQWVDRLIAREGFAEAMQKAGWLVVSDAGVRFPKFNEHNGETSKRRSLTAKRNASLRRRKRDDASVTNVTPSASPREEEEKKKKEKKKEHKRTPFTPPSEVEVRAYCQERRNGIDSEHFVAYYETRGWRTPSGPVVDWRACVRTWEQRQQQDRANRANPELRHAEDVCESGFLGEHDA